MTCLILLLAKKIYVENKKHKHPLKVSFYNVIEIICFILFEPFLAEMRTLKTDETVVKI